MSRCLPLLALLLLVGAGAGAEVNSLSVIEATRFLALDAEIVQHLREYLRKETDGGDGAYDRKHSKIPSSLENINRYISEFEAITAGQNKTNEESEAEGVPAADPLWTMVIARRLGKDWPALREAQYKNNQSWHGVVKAVEAAEFRLGVVGGQEEVAGGTALSLMRLHHVYNLHAHHLARGSSSLGPDNATRRPAMLLRPSDMSTVGVKAMEKELYGRAAEWFTASRDAVANIPISESSNHGRKNNIFRRQMEVLLNISTSIHDLMLIRKGFSGQAGIFPRQLSQIPLMEQKEVDVTPPDIEQYGKETRMGTITSPRDELTFSRLCRGHKLLNPWEERRLTCRLDDRGSPYLVLMPARVEEISHDPLIIAFRDVLTHKQMEIIKSLARPSLEQAATALGLNSDTIAVRSSHTAWLRDDTHAIIHKVNAKVSALTGLDVTEDEGGEVLQVNLYGSGGHYLPHHDFVGLHYRMWEQELPDFSLQAEHPLGDRIATFMFYMNGVEAGGRTVFPRARVGVEPTKGSAVFWWNLLPNGMSDFRTLHGACPVIQGTKWVANKWIKHHPQIHRRPCPVP